MDQLDKVADIFFDPNVENKAKGGRVSDTDYSEDGKLMSFKVKKNGSDWATLHVKDAHTMKDLPDTISWLKFTSVEWSLDSLGFFYNTFDPPKNKEIGKKSGAGKETEKLVNMKVLYHKIGTK